MRALLFSLYALLMLCSPLQAQDQHYHFVLDDPLQGVTFTEMDNFYSGTLTNNIFTLNKINSAHNGNVAFWFNNLKNSDVIHVSLQEIAGNREFYSLQFHDGQVWMDDSREGLQLIDTRDVNGSVFRIEKCESYLIYHLFGYPFKHHDLLGNTAEFQIVVEVASADQTVLNLDISSTPEKICCPLEPDADLGLNWITTTTYDGNGEDWINIVGESRAYSDELGRTIQSQSKDFRTNKIWATATLFDQKGRPAIATLPAPTDYTNIRFKTNFVTDAAGNPYDTDDFDLANTPAGQTGEVNNPNPVGTQAGTLGAWYSSQNTEEPYQATSQFPYTRTEYSELTNQPRHTGSPGDAYRMGNGHEVSGYTMSAGTELEQIFGTGNRSPMCLLVATPYNIGGAISNQCLGTYTGIRQYFKSISIDADGQQAVVFTDVSGREVASCLSGQVVGANQQIQPTEISVPELDYRDIHVTDVNGSTSTISLSPSEGNPAYSIYDLSTDELIIPFSQSSSLSLAPGFYRILNRSSLSNLKVSYDLNYYNFSINIFDESGRLIANVAPKDVNYSNPSNPQHGAFSFYKYNSLGQLIWEESPDAGHTDYYYREDGLLRFSKNAKQAAVGTFSYTKYDRLGRSVEVGECNTLPSNLQGFVDQNDYPSTGLSQQTYHQYDRPDATPPNGRQQRFLMGRLTKSSTADNLTSWYSYDAQGRMEWMAQKIDDQTGLKFTDYSYDLQGNVLEAAYQKGSAEAFIHHYTYLRTGELQSVETSTNGSNRTEQASYEFAVDGGIKKVNIADGLQEMHYVYTLQGQLKAVNPDDMSTYDMAADDKVFSMALDYYPGDYLPATATDPSNFNNLFNLADANYSGSIAVQRWKSRATVASVNLSGAFSYSYQYNHRNELKTATYGLQQVGSGSYNGNLVSSGDFKVTASYDLNGNIKNLNRWSCTGCAGPYQFDQLTYNYDYLGGKNQLNYIGDENILATPAGDLATQLPNNYAYDDIGQLTDDVKEDLRIEYDVYGKVTKVFEKSSNALKVEYIYDANGQRAKKIVHDALTMTTWYLRDGGGGLTSIYEQSGNAAIVQKELPIYAGGRVGTAYRNAGLLTYKYEVSDHLGNVRATFGRDATGNLEVYSYADYYPYGWKIPTRQANPNGYRFGYQGEFAEQDAETGWNAFELRMYDGRVGRWMTIDPAREFYSPYQAMGNDPTNLIDPDGAKTDNYYLNLKTNEVSWIDGSGYKAGYVDLGTDYDFAMTQFNILNTLGINENTFLGFARQFDESLYDSPHAASGAFYGYAASLSEEEQIAFRSGRSYVTLGDALQADAITGEIALLLFPYGKIFQGIGYVAKGTNVFGLGYIRGGKTFARYKAARGGTQTLAKIETSTGVQRISTEFHHVFITQRLQKAQNLPHWMVNNRLNVWKVNTIQHSIIDSFRFRFLRKGIKSEVGLFKKYGWFTKF